MRSIRWIFPVLLVLLVGAVSCAPAATAEPLPGVISPQDASSRLESGDDVVLLDVRTPQEWTGDGRSPDATFIPLQELEARYSELDKNDTIMIICRSGNRSQAAADFLRQQGFNRVTEVQGGMINWIRQGMDYECDTAVCALAQ
ncbi:MAG: rhodanese-like domain-containing protein [Anaerolineae bacterium]|nr:rhodanese-like domain-containing protein [Anaerolineae bacterium]